MVTNRTCNPNSIFKQFETLEDAKTECKKSRPCKGVLAVDCIKDESYSICEEIKAVLSDEEVDSCLHEKYEFGTCFL